MTIEFRTLTDLRGQTHEVRIINKWGVRLLMLDKAKYWLPVIEDGSWERLQRAYFITRMRTWCPTVGIDVGANNGIYTLLMCREPGLQRVISIEPCEPHFSLMCESIRINGFASRCEPHCLACSNESSTKPMYVFPNETPSLNQFLETRVKTNTEIKQLRGWIEMVKSRPLDEVVKLTGQRIILKIDTEGHELRVIEGAKGLLTRNRCFLQVESFDDSLVQPLAELGYQCLHRIGDDLYFDNIT